MSALEVRFLAKAAAIIPSASVCRLGPQRPGMAAFSIFCYGFPKGRNYHISSFLKVGNHIFCSLYCDFAKIIWFSLEVRWIFDLFSTKYDIVRINSSFLNYLIILSLGQLSNEHVL